MHCFRLCWYVIMYLVLDWSSAPFSIMSVILPYLVDNIPVMQYTNTYVCLLACHRGLATQSVSAPSCRMDSEAGRHNQQNTRSRATPIRSRDVLSIPENPQAVLTVTKPALLLTYNFICRFWTVIGLSNPCQTPLALF